MINFLPQSCTKSGTKVLKGLIKKLPYNNEMLLTFYPKINDL
jgi:hypothetical protein